MSPRSVRQRSRRRSRPRSVDPRRGSRPCAPRRELPSLDVPKPFRRKSWRIRSRASRPQPLLSSRCPGSSRRRRRRAALRSQGRRRNSSARSPSHPARSLPHPGPPASRRSRRSEKGSPRRSRPAEAGRCSRSGRPMYRRPSRGRCRHRRRRQGPPVHWRTARAQVRSDQQQRSQQDRRRRLRRWRLRQRRRQWRWRLPRWRLRQWPSRRLPRSSLRSASRRRRPTTPRAQLRPPTLCSWRKLLDRKRSCRRRGGRLPDCLRSSSGLPQLRSGPHDRGARSRTGRAVRLPRPADPWLRHCQTSRLGARPEPNTMASSG